MSYVLSFVYLGIYWNNHHHLLHAADARDRRVLWANLHLLFWLSLYPFTTSGWPNRTWPGPRPPVRNQPAAAAIAYFVLQ